MAKVSGPLFSFGASGKLANSLVFMKWKGIADVRQWLKPANPKSTAQVTQRGVMTDAVAQWHDVGITAGDQAAWNSWAGLQAKPMSGFNKFVKEYIRITNAADAWKLLFGGSAVAGAAGVLTVEVDSADEVTVVVAKYGTKKTLLLSEANLAFVAGVWTASIAGLSSGVKYYVQFTQVAAGIEGISGIYEGTAG